MWRCPGPGLFPSTLSAHEALGTNIAHLLADYQGLLALIAKVAGPGGHLAEAIDLITNRRDEARVIALNELQTLTDQQREEFTLAAARQTALAMRVAADMLARTGLCLNAPDAYDFPPYVVAAVGAVLTTSGLLGDAVKIVTGDE